MGRPLPSQLWTAGNVPKAWKVIQVTVTQELPTLGPIARYEQNIIERISDFNDPRQEWRPLSELLGTFLLVGRSRRGSR
jgi:hypothetical protein